MNSFKTIAIIPARYNSTRFPGKMLADIRGKSLIQTTYENAKGCSALDTVIVATDDKRIFDHVSSFGGEVIMTSPNCHSGSDRIAEVIKLKGGFSDSDIIVNIQGDEPLIAHDTIEKVVAALANESEAEVSTAIIEIKSEEDAKDPHVVKCVRDDDGYALYFSRAMIPFGKSGAFRSDVTYYKHLGIYAYRSHFLQKYTSIKPSPLQVAEDLEQLKILEHGYKIKTAVVTKDSIGIDTPEDLRKILD